MKRLARVDRCGRACRVEGPGARVGFQLPCEWPGPQRWHHDERRDAQGDEDKRAWPVTIPVLIDDDRQGRENQNDERDKRLAYDVARRELA